MVREVAHFHCGARGHRIVLMMSGLLLTERAGPLSSADRIPRNEHSDMRPLSIHHERAMLCCAMTETASVSLPSGAMVKSALPSDLEDFAHLHGSPSRCVFPHDNIPGNPRAPRGTNRRTMPLRSWPAGNLVRLSALERRRSQIFPCDSTGRKWAERRRRARRCRIRASRGAMAGKAARANVSGPDDSHSAFNVGRVARGNGFSVLPAKGGGVGSGIRMQGSSHRHERRQRARVRSNSTAKTDAAGAWIAPSARARPQAAAA